MDDFEPSIELEIIVVNDGSIDKTSERVIEFDWAQIKLIELISNAGHMGALEAGLNYTSGDLVITMDGDQQHPPKYISEMVKIQYETQCDVVLGLRVRGSETSFLRRKISEGFYKLLSVATDISIQNNGGEFRLMTRQVVDELIRLRESQKVYRFLISQLGFKIETFNFQTPPRMYGESKYSIKHLWKLGIHSLIGFSTVPLTAIFLGGLTIFVISMFYLIFLLISYFFGNVLPGWTSLSVLIVGLASLQIMAIGIIGRYISQLLIETRQRPRYIVRSIHNSLRKSQTDE
jgi:dolichol-phosphate mannosyltransferase